MSRCISLFDLRNASPAASCSMKCLAVDSGEGPRAWMNWPRSPPPQNSKTIRIRRSVVWLSRRQTTLAGFRGEGNFNKFWAPAGLGGVIVHVSSPVGGLNPTAWNIPGDRGQLHYEWNCLAPNRTQEKYRNCPFRPPPYLVFIIFKT